MCGLGCEVSLEDFTAPVAVNPKLCIAQAGEGDRVAGGVVNGVVALG